MVDLPQVQCMRLALPRGQNSLAGYWNSHADTTELAVSPVWRVQLTAGGRMPEASLVSIVEDDRFFRESMRRLMRSLGYRAEVFRSAAAFLESPRLAKTAVLIADIYMPVMTGLELFRNLINTGRPIPTILMTSYPDADLQARALSEGVVCYLPKPVDERHLVRCLRAALQPGEAT
jgi:FixJ family two-component response regulator